MTQEGLEAASDVSRQTIIRYESGTAVSPKASEVRAVCRALRIDPREAVIALGFVTRSEMDLPPLPPPLDPVVADVQRFLNDERLPVKVRNSLRRGVKAVRDMWLEMAAVPAPKEPAARKATAAR